MTIIIILFWEEEGYSKCYLSIDYGHLIGKLWDSMNQCCIVLIGYIAKTIPTFQSISYCICMLFI